MPAANNGAGMRVGFPDVCMTPPLGAPVPYPNLGLNCMSAVFSPNIFVGYMPQLTMASVVPLTLGDQAGSMHPLFMQMGGATAGNPRVLINCLPAMSLCTPTYGNLFNNPVGLVAVPSVTTTMYSDAEACRAVDAKAPLPVHEQRALRDAVEGDREAVLGRSLGDAIGLVAIHRMTRDVGARLYNAIRRAKPERGLVIDLRDNPGGDLDAALDAAADFFPAGAELARVDRGAGPVAIRARGAAMYRGRVVVLIGARTGSAAEAFAGALGHGGRATLVGARSFGKACAQSAVRRPSGELVYETVATVSLADGARFDAGLEPDVAVEESRALERAVELLRDRP
ncbi:MAG: S41 family peptidase [Polyangiaceae bacterium]